MKKPCCLPNLAHQKNFMEKEHSNFLFHFRNIFDRICQKIPCNENGNIREQTSANPETQRIFLKKKNPKKLDIYCLFDSAPQYTIERCHPTISCQEKSFQLKIRLELLICLRFNKYLPYCKLIKFQVHRHHLFYLQLECQQHNIQTMQTSNRQHSCKRNALKKQGKKHTHKISIGTN